VTIEGYSFTRRSIRKESRNEESRTVLKVGVSATDSPVFDKATVTVSIKEISGEPLLYYDPGQTRSMLLERGSFVEVRFEISTANGNSYTGPVQFRLEIVNVVDNSTGASITANVTIEPPTGLVTNPPGQILQIVP
jgi:hypothetical protein